MYSWIDDRRSLKNMSSLALLPRNVNMRMRSRLINISQLPVIEEERDESDEIKCKNYPNSNFKRNGQNKYALQDTLYHYDNKLLRNNKTVKEWINNTKPTKLPPLVNINCMMNADVKQSHHVWDTNFGKRLINGRNIEYNLISSENPKILETQKTKNVKEPSEIMLKKNLLRHRNLTVLNKINKNSVGDIKFKPKKPTIPKIKHKNPNELMIGNENTGKNKNTLNKKKDSESNLNIQSNTKTTTPESTLTSLDDFRWNGNDSSEASGTFSFCENQHFLTDWVKNILDKASSSAECEYCEETFSDAKELIEHKKKHEEEKQTCLLCGKIFHLGSTFIQHLLSHEGVDRLTCKKCKIYFPSLKKYKQHCNDVHLTSSEISKSHHEGKKPSNQWFFKYECRRCKEEFSSEEALGAHRRNHIKMDLMGAYLLNPKNFIE